ncbi:ClpXP protease specificity-enhancing factor [Porticoccaceae bacterium]|nr:ClpXP protease specificity-enhancing factor [Porticoccaceae bacterium]MDA8663515.1 ClpXP protease specificity-enhancing factor [Porticoccaceae bacterium]MDA8682568.1 ClpXP protease specificity-enhancing factor [Porticoccaceae bacterium]MDA8788795.1 ClpXP protease specificity-enhancing factor [Porticoccaceae bacterium]MDB2663642.1 ClpXP protease specificity-enhancing factor [Porticoccaceae bacterium]
MHSNRPYLVRAFFDWIVDNQCTPHVIVDASYDGVSVPLDFVKDGQIVLNIAPRAVSNFIMSHESVSFSTRFSGVPVDLYLPSLSIVGIYAQENGRGMMFEQDDDPPPKPSKTIEQESSSASTSRKTSKPSLRIIK